MSALQHQIEPAEVGELRVEDAGLRGEPGTVQGRLDKLTRDFRRSQRARGGKSGEGRAGKTALTLELDALSSFGG